MKEKIVEYADEKGEQCCPDLDGKTRCIWFCVTAAIGFILYISTLTAIFTATFGTRTACFVFTAGSLLILASTFFLAGPKTQCKNMLQPVRATLSICFVASIVATIIIPFIIDKLFLNMICFGCQLVFMLLYTFSYIPGGTDCLITCTKSCCQSCCCGNKEGEEQTPIV